MDTTITISAVLLFLILSYFVYLIRKLNRRPRTWRITDKRSGFVMFVGARTPEAARQSAYQTMSSGAVSAEGFDPKSFLDTNLSVVEEY